MKARISKDRVTSTSIKSVYTIILLAVYRGLYEKYGFGPERLNRLTEWLASFFETEDLSTIGDELTYWADKKGIKY